MPRPIIINPPAPPIRSIRSGERANQSRAAPAASAKLPSLMIPMTPKIAPSVGECGEGEGQEHPQHDPADQIPLLHPIGPLRIVLPLLERLKDRVLNGGEGSVEAIFERAQRDVIGGAVFEQGFQQEPLVDW